MLLRRKAAHFATNSIPALEGQIPAALCEWKATIMTQTVVQTSAVLCRVPSLTDRDGCFWQIVFFFRLPVSQWTCYFYTFGSSLSKSRIFLSAVSFPTRGCDTKVTADLLSCSGWGFLFAQYYKYETRQQISSGHWSPSPITTHRTAMAGELIGQQHHTQALFDWTISEIQSWRL